mmetsp:Transcript_5753/g.22729  ORF Transcript_5753/g.22729 Transcript_5753/m.22729 type:complete len:227 (-) Transcript_5753:499-1179(-)
MAHAADAPGCVRGGREGDCVHCLLLAGPRPPQQQPRAPQPQRIRLPPRPQRLQLFECDSARRAAGRTCALPAGVHIRAGAEGWDLVGLVQRVLVPARARPRRLHCLHATQRCEQRAGQQRHVRPGRPLVVSAYREGRRARAALLPRAGHRHHQLRPKAWLRGGAYGGLERRWVDDDSCGRARRARRVQLSHRWLHPMRNARPGEADLARRQRQRGLRAELRARSQH